MMKRTILALLGRQHLADGHGFGAGQRHADDLRSGEQMAVQLVDLGRFGFRGQGRTGRTGRFPPTTSR